MLNSYLIDIEIIAARLVNKSTRRFTLNIDMICAYCLLSVLYFKLMGGAGIGQGLYSLKPSIRI